MANTIDRAAMADAEAIQERIINPLRQHLVTVTHNLIHYYIGARAQDLEGPWRWTLLMGTAPHQLRYSIWVTITHRDPYQYSVQIKKLVPGGEYEIITPEFPHTQILQLAYSFINNIFTPPGPLVDPLDPNQRPPSSGPSVNPPHLSPIPDGPSRQLTNQFQPDTSLRSCLPRLTALHEQLTQRVERLEQKLH